MGSQTSPFRTVANHGSTAAALIVVACIGLLYTGPVYRLLGPQTVLRIYDLTVIASAATGLWLSFLLWRSFSPGEASRTIWACLALGLGLWAAGEALWSYDQLIGGETLPYSSTANVAWVVGFIPLTLGLYLRYRSFQIKPRKPWQIAVLWSFVGLAVLADVFVIVPVLIRGSTGSFVDQAANLLYPAGDLVLAFQALLLVLVLAGGSLSLPWALIASGFLCLAVSDILYVFSLSQGFYEAEPAGGANVPTFIVNVLYVAGYAVVALGLYRQARIQKAI